MMSDKNKYAEATAAKADAVATVDAKAEQKAAKAEQKAQFALQQLQFSATRHCRACSHGLAREAKLGVPTGDGDWSCSAVLLGLEVTQRAHVKHDEHLPADSVKPEGYIANGATTRPGLTPVAG